MLLSIIIIVASVALDAATKLLAATYLTSTSVTVIPGVLEFVYVENRGMAFGMLADHRWVFLVVSSVAIIAMVAYLIANRRTMPTLAKVAIALIAGGGIGNMIDRVICGYVTDFINVTFVDFYVFNVADSCVTVGCAMLILWLIVDSVREKREKKAALAAGGVGSEDDDA